VRGMTQMTSGQLYLRLLGYVKPYWKAFAAFVVALIVTAATEPALPALMKPMLDGTFVERDPYWIRMIPVVIIGLFVVRGIATYIGTYAGNWVGNKVVTDMREAMFRKLVQLPGRYYADSLSGNLISKVSYDASQVTGAATTVLTSIVKDSIVILGLLGVMFYYNWKLSLLALLMAPLIVGVVHVISRRLRRASRETQRAMGEMTQVLQETIEGHKVVKLFGGQAYENGRFSRAANLVRHFGMKQVNAAAINVPVVQLIAAVALAIIVYIATVESETDRTTVGEFVAFIAAMLMLTSPLKRLTGINEFLQKGLAAAESVFALIDEEPEHDPGRVEIGRARGELVLDRVSFSYDGARPALADISLVIRPGETVALVGQSGSGKTTLANLIPRFYHPTSGRILLDGHDLESLTLASLRANIALVSQDVVLFNDTVRANIAYGAMRGAGEEQVRAAAEAAHALQFIRELPDGLDTLVGENGVKLSGGQRQRLAIARALLKDAPILILDEATSALDTESERHVQAALEALMRNRTTLVIAHRLSTIERADRIVALDQGRVAESGTHAELLAHNGIYARLYRTQFSDQEAVSGEQQAASSRR
jgi:subfamily B ATP-binding cassette protein MsbA